MRSLVHLTVPILSLVLVPCARMSIADPCLDSPWPAELQRIQASASWRRGYSRAEQLAPAGRKGAVCVDTSQLEEFFSNNVNYAHVCSPRIRDALGTADVMSSALLVVSILVSARAF